MALNKVASGRPVVSTNGTSPTSTNSPPVLTPATPSTVNKPLAPMPGSIDAPMISINKTWVLPPKPKPGRKPALDTPPTKRKAQNREAQRAFRERRAAKVGELEEEMKKMEEEDAKEQEALREIIRLLERRLEDFKNRAETWREKFNEMQMACGRERQLREQAVSDLMILRNDAGSETEAIPLPARTKGEPRDQQTNGLQDMNANREHSTISDEMPITCGKCSNDTRCQCIEEAFEMSNIADEQTFKRPHSPPSNTTENKRIRQTSNIDEDTEIDFTAQFSTCRAPTLTTSSSTASSSIPAIAPPDPCGFCSDGTPCICAEMAKEASRQQNIQVPAPQSPTINQPKTDSTSKNPGSCISGPGTCAQCLSNPTSTLFCKTVAAANNLPSISTSTSTLSPPPPPSSHTPTPIKLTCADAFTTLSRHPGFSAATNELTTWVPQLTAIPKQNARAMEGAPERTAFDIEAASVMSVLKFFDRRFGSDG